MRKIRRPPNTAGMLRVTGNAGRAHDRKLTTQIENEKRATRDLRYTDHVRAVSRVDPITERSRADRRRYGMKRDTIRYWQQQAIMTRKMIGTHLGRSLFARSANRDLQTQTARAIAYAAIAYAAVNTPDRVRRQLTKGTN